MSSLDTPTNTPNVEILEPVTVELPVGLKSLPEPARLEVITHIAKSEASHQIVVKKMAENFSDKIVSNISDRLVERLVQEDCLALMAQKILQLSQEQGISLIPQQPEGSLRFKRYQKRDEDGNLLPIEAIVAAAKLPKRAEPGSAGLDLYAIEDVVIPPRSNVIARTGWTVALDDGTYGRVAPKSGLAWKAKLDTDAGVIDKSYRGEIGVMLRNQSDNEYIIKAGNPMAQLIEERIKMSTPIEVDSLDETQRGEGGYGSTHPDTQ
jgi:dUTP pyrophosphatase